MAYRAIDIDLSFIPPGKILDIEKEIHRQVTELTKAYTLGRTCIIVNARSHDAGDSVRVEGFGKYNTEILSVVSEIVYKVKDENS